MKTIDEPGTCTGEEECGHSCTVIWITLSLPLKVELDTSETVGSYRPGEN